MWVASDLWEPIAGNVSATWYSWSGDALNTTLYEFALDPLDSKPFSTTIGWSNILPGRSELKDSVLILKANSQSHDSMKIYTGERFWVPNYLNNATLVDPGLELEKLDQKTWSVKARKGVAAYVWMTAPNGVTGYWDQNAVFEVKGEIRNFTFVVQDRGNGSKWEDGVHARSLWNNYEVDVAQVAML